MKADILRPEDPAWTEALAGLEHDVYHLPRYAAATASSDGGDPYAILVGDGRGSLLAPLVLRPVPGADCVDATSPYGYPGPIVSRGASPQFLAEASETLAAALGELGAVSYFARLHPLLPVAELGAGAVAIEHGETVVVDLTETPEAMWAQTAKGHRNEINRARKDGHRAFPDPDFQALEVFQDAYEQTMERVSAVGYYFFPRSYFDQLREALGGRLQLWLAEVRGEIAGGALFMECGGIVQYHLSGTLDRFVNDRPTKLILDEARRYYRGREDRFLHLGGGVGSGEDTLFRFKAGFSRGRGRFRTLRLVVDRERYAALVKERQPQCDPAALDGYFPAYRKPPPDEPASDTGAVAAPEGAPGT
ncbi:MAG: GNAT family N-acetyltransferase [Myxococcales bacterium]